jgi:hypothetical protein
MAQLLETLGPRNDLLVGLIVSFSPRRDSIYLDGGIQTSIEYRNRPSDFSPLCTVAECDGRLLEVRTPSEQFLQLRAALGRDEPSVLLLG